MELTDVFSRMRKDLYEGRIRKGLKHILMEGALTPYAKNHDNLPNEVLTVGTRIMLNFMATYDERRLPKSDGLDDVFADIFISTKPSFERDLIYTPYTAVARADYTESESWPVASIALFVESISPGSYLQFRAELPYGNTQRPLDELDGKTKMFIGSIWKHILGFNDRLDKTGFPYQFHLVDNGRIIASGEEVLGLIGASTLNIPEKKFYNGLELGLVSKTI